jgi:hypothetical protein
MRRLLLLVPLLVAACQGLDRYGTPIEDSEPSIVMEPEVTAQPETPACGTGEGDGIGGTGCDSN